MDLSDRSNPFLRRLTAKEILGVTKKGKTSFCLFSHLVSKEQYGKKEAEGFVESKFGGSLKKFSGCFSGQ